MFRSALGKVNQFLRKSLIGILRGYQYVLSPVLGQRCRFYPSCSHYAVEALTHYNLIKGCYLIFCRLIRCHPFHPGGYDPLISTQEQKNH